MGLFSRWVRESEKEMKPLVEKFGKWKGLPREGYEEKLLQQYLTFRIVRVTWILVVVTALIGLLSAIINLVVLIK
ncbi:hypothetical protein KAR91_39310 [Candidatus Pacearchaeota archaeon]|nr:hypothetical protein [Candidatus Pacearchaeota archaeon]